MTRGGSARGGRVVRRRWAAALLAGAIATTACGGQTVTVPVAAVGGGGCPEDAGAGPGLSSFVDRDGACVPPTRLLEVRCDGAPPWLVLGYGAARARRYLGGRFAVPIDAPPAGSRPVGRSGDAEVLQVPGDPSWLFVRTGAGTARWLRLPRTPPADPPALAVIGDSIADGARSAIAELLPGWDVAVDAEIGRTSAAGAAASAGVAATAPDVVVVELGTNDVDPERFRANAQATLDALAGVPLLLWQTVHGSDAAPEINRAVRDLVGRYPNTAIVDWHASVDPEVLGSDGVHPLPGHEAAMADLLAPLAWKWYASVNGTDSARCPSGDERR